MFSYGSARRRTAVEYSLCKRYSSTSNCSTPTTPTMTSLQAGVRLVEDLDGALLRDLADTGLELLALHRVLALKGGEVLGRKRRDALEADLLVLEQIVSPME